MSSQSRRLERNRAKRLAAVEKKGEGELTQAQKMVPTGCILTEPVLGDFQTVPLLGWIAHRNKENVPLIMLRVALLEPSNLESGMSGILQIELPYYKGQNDRATAAALKAYGWQGTTWAIGEENWPAGDEENEDQYKVLMEQAGLKRSLVFPPTDGFASLMFKVTKAKGPFLMAPLSIPDEGVSDELMQLLTDLCEKPPEFIAPEEPTEDSA